MNAAPMPADHPHNLLLRLIEEAMENAANNPDSWRSMLTLVEAKFRGSLLAWRDHYGDVVGDIAGSHVLDPTVRAELIADLLSNLDEVVEDAWFRPGMPK